MSVRCKFAKCEMELEGRHCSKIKRERRRGNQSEVVQRLGQQQANIYGLRSTLAE